MHTVYETQLPGFSGLMACCEAVASGKKEGDAKEEVPRYSDLFFMKHL